MGSPIAKAFPKYLLDGFNTYGNLEFGQVEDKNHKEKCWLETEPNAIIPFEKMIENQKVLKELEDTEPFSIVV